MGDTAGGTILSAIIFLGRPVATRNNAELFLPLLLIGFADGLPRAHGVAPRIRQTGAMSPLAARLAA